MTNPTFNESVPAGSFSESTPRQRAAYARLVENARALKDSEDEAQRLASLSSDDFSREMQSTTAPRQLPPSPGHISSDDISQALASELSRYAPNATTGAPVTA